MATTINRALTTVPSVSSTTSANASEIVRDVFARRENILRNPDPALIDTYLSKKYPSYGEEKLQLEEMQSANKKSKEEFPLIAGVDVTNLHELYMTATVVFQNSDETQTAASFSFIRQSDNWVMLGEVPTQLSADAMNRILAKGA